MKLRIGTRASRLARLQAGRAAGRLESLGHETEIVPISTAGDRSSAPSFASIGPQGVFVRELEQALLAGTIDLAVHSYKDLPTASPGGLEVAALPERLDSADALIVRGDRTPPGGDGLHRVPENAVVGTASVRRQAWLLHFRPDLRVESLRGNVLTRLRRLREGRYDAILLALAGLERLRGAGEVAGEPEVDFRDLTVVRLDPEVFVPAPAQGALALQCRRADERVRRALAPLDDACARAAVGAERALLARFEGGCELAFGAWCRSGGPDPGKSALFAMVERDGRVERAAARGAEPAELVEEVWRALSADPGGSHRLPSAGRRGA